MVTEEGTPVPGRDINFYAEVHGVDEEGTEIIHLEPLGTGTTDRNGMYTAPASLGREAVELAPESPAIRMLSFGHTDTLVRHISLDESGVAIEEEPDTALEIQPLPGTMSTSSDSTMIVAVVAPTAAAAEDAVQPLGHNTACDFPTFKATSTYTNRWVPVQRSRTRTNAKIAYYWEDTRKTRLEIAADGKWGKHKAGMSYSISHWSSSGWSSTLDYNTTRRIEADWKFRRYDLHCILWTGGTVYHGSWEWRPYKREGNKNVHGSTVGTIPCSVVRRHDNPEWVVKGAAKTFSGAYSIATLSLKSEQSRSSKHKLRLLPKNTSGAKWFCGSNAIPLEAREVQEWYKSTP